MREPPRFLWRTMGVRATLVRPRARRERPCDERFHARLLPPGAESLRRGHDHEAVARDAEEQEAQATPRAVSRHQDQALLPARLRATGTPIPAETRLIGSPHGGVVGEVYLSQEEIAARVAELGREIAADYADLEPLLVAPLKSSAVFLVDLSRAISAPHTIDLIELAAYTGGKPGGVRLLKDLEGPIADRHVLIVE